MRKVHYVANSQFRHIFFRHALVYGCTRIEAQPELSTRQQQHSHHVVLQAFTYKDSKNRENLQINRTATVQQYRYTSIEPFSSISTVYSSTIHPRANSLTLNPFSTIGVKSNSIAIIGMSASETNAYTDCCVWYSKENSVAMTDTRPLSRRRQVLWEPYLRNSYPNSRLLLKCQPQESKCFRWLAYPTTRSQL